MYCPDGLDLSRGILVFMPDRKCFVIYYSLQCRGIFLYFMPDREWVYTLFVVYITLHFIVPASILTQLLPINFSDAHFFTDIFSVTAIKKMEFSDVFKLKSNG